MQFAILVEVYDSLVSGTDQASSGFFHDQGNHSEATLQVTKYILKLCSDNKLISVVN